MQKKKATHASRQKLYLCLPLYNIRERRREREREKKSFHKSQGKISLPTVKTSYYINDLLLNEIHLRYNKQLYSTTIHLYATNENIYTDKLEGNLFYYCCL